MLMYQCIALCLCYLILVIDRSIAGGLGEGPETCVGSTMNKLMFNQTGYTQFIYLGLFDVPDLSAFHTCFWVNLLDPARRATIVHYAHEDATRSNKINIEWTGGQKPTWLITINSFAFDPIIASSIRRDTWHHACISWNDAEKEVAVFQDGAFIGSVVTSELSQLVIPGKGGLFAIGQNHQAILLNGMDQGAGMEGFITLFHFDSRPITDPSGRDAYKQVRNLYTDCRAKDRGDIVGWLRTHRKGYGGVTEIFAQEKCGRF